VAINRQFSVSPPHFWWPRRKDEEAGEPKRSALRESESPQKYRESHLTRSRPKYYQVPKKIHILGAGNLGGFVAHALAGIPNRPPVTLLLRRRQLRQWEEHGQSIDVTSHGMTQTRRGFEVEVPRSFRGNLPGPEEIYPDLDQELQKKSGAWEAVMDPATISRQERSEFREEGRIGTGLSPDDSNLFTDSSPSPHLEIDAHALRGTHTDPIAPSEEPRLTSREEREMKEWFAQDENGQKEPRPQENSQQDEEDTPSYEGDEDVIYNLVVSVKAPRTVKAIQAIAHRLISDSTILFLQNGMGIIDEVNEKLFPDKEYRPTYIVGVVSHGLYSTGPFSVNHAGEGTIALGVMPRMPIQGPLANDSINQLAASARYLIRTMTRTPVLVAVGFPPTDLFQQQLDKLAVNCIINPLTAILDCKNGALLSNFHFTRVVRLLLAEISIVIKSLPELKDVPNVNMRFDTLRLERLVVSIADTTRSNHSSMLQDIRAGRQTEIDYINGYIIRRGEEMGIHCVMNYMLMHMLKGKVKTSSLEQEDLLPLAGGDGRRR